MTQVLLLISILGQGTQVPWPDRNLSTELLMGKSSSVLRQAFDHADIKVKVNGSIGDEIVALECKNLVVGEVAERVANGLCAEWKQSGDTYYLARTKKQVSDIEAESKKLFEAKLTEQLEHLSNQLQGMPTALDRANLIIEAFREGSGRTADELTRYQPQPILLRQLLVSIGAARLSELPFGRAIAFSDAPTVLQQKLPQNCKENIELYHEAEAFLSKVITDGGVPPTLESWFKLIFDSANERSPGKCILILRRILNSVWATLGTYSVSGKLRGSAALFLQIDTSKKTVSTLPKMGTSPASENFLEWAVASKENTSNRTREDLPPAILSPDRFEPLDVTTRAIIESTTKTLKADGMFAVLDDRCADIATRSLSENDLNADKFWVSLHQEGVAKAEFDGRWLLVQPLDRFGTEKRRLNRNALKRYVDTVERGNPYSIRETGLLRANSGYQSLREPLFRTYLRAMGAADAYEQARGMADPALEVIGSVSDVQWSDLQKGRSIKFQQLSAQPQSALADWISQVIRACTKPVGMEATIPDQKLTGSELPSLEQLNSVELSLDISNANIFRVKNCPSNYQQFFPNLIMDRSWFQERIQNMLDIQAILSVNDLDTVMGQVGTSNDPQLRATLPSGVFASARFRGAPKWEDGEAKISSLIKR